MTWSGDLKKKIDLLGYFRLNTNTVRLKIKTVDV